MQYELFYLVGASKEAELDKIKAEVSEIVTSEEGVFEEKQVVEKRKMAYQVNHESYGFYVAQRFNIEDTSKLSAINKRLNLYTGILRFLISRTEDLPELVSREERKEKAFAAEKEARKEAQTREAATAKEISQPEKKKEITAEETATKKADEEDIDKKLEEILNI